MAIRIVQVQSTAATGLAGPRPPDELAALEHTDSENRDADVGRIEVDRGFPVVRLTGDLDLLTRPALQRLLSSAVARPAHTVVIVTSAVTFIDCAGLHPLLLTAEGLRQRRACLLMLRPSAAVQRLAALTGTREFLSLMYTSNAARA